MSSPSSDAGFSLVEMLVSLALLAVAALLLTQGYAAARGAWGRIERRVGAGEEVVAAQERLRGALERLSPATRYEAGAPKVDFDGGAETLDFLSAPNGSGAPRAVERERLQLGRDGDLELVSSSPDLTDGRGEVRTLLRGVQRLSLSYYGAAEAGSAPGWSPSWSHAAAPPELVGVRLGFAPGDRRTWPVLIVRPGAVVDAGCMLDPASGGCRGRS